MSNAPRFSVVIPTRNRAQTLRHSLTTCIAQDFDDYEVVVSDNQSTPETRQVVEDLRSPKVRYVQTPRVLSMAGNFEFALENASGEFVTMIGDDDGLLPHSLRTMNNVLGSLQAKILRWPQIYYIWPGSVFDAISNRLSIPLGREVEWVESRPVISGVANGTLDPQLLPSVYHGAVHRDLISELKQRTGRVFGGSVPDVFAAFAFGFLSGRYPSLSFPLTIAGLSSHSNGSAMVRFGDESDTFRDFRRLNDTDGFRTDPRVPAISGLQPMLADMFWQAKALLFPTDRFLDIDRKAFAKRALLSLVWTTLEERDRGIQAIRHSLCDDSRLVRWFDAWLVPPTTCTAYRSLHVPWGFREVSYHEKRLAIDASRFGVGDVSAASTLCDSLLRHPESEPFQLVETKRLAPYRRIRAAARVLLRGR